MVTELVMLNMGNLPRFVPKSFQHTYTPIAAAGNDAQVCAPDSRACCYVVQLAMEVY